MRTEKVKVAKQFLCNECSKTFDSSANLKRHMLVDYMPQLEEKASQQNYCNV